jgi:YVTN family beta-propeller protein
MIKSSLFMLLISMTVSIQVHAQSKSSYRVLRTNTIKGAAAWDYISVDPDQHRLYISNGTRVVILNELTGDSIDVIPNTPGVHGIAIVNSLGKGYTSNGRGNNVTVFDLKTNKALAEIKTGQNPDAIFYDDYSKKIITCNGRSNDALIIDPLTEKVISTIPLGGKPETAVSNGKGQVFINIENTNEVVQLNTNSFKIEKRWKLDGGEEPTGLAIDRITERLFVGCGNKLMLVLNAATGQTLVKLPIGDGCDGVTFDQTLKRAVASNGEGTMTIVQETDSNKFDVIQILKTENRGRTITMDQKTHHIFIPSLGSATAGTFHVLEVGE